MPDAIVTLTEFALVCFTLYVLVHHYAYPLLERLVKIKEYEAAARAAAIEAVPVPQMPPFPLDLQARVNALSEDWARDDLERSIREHFVEARRMVPTDDDAWVAVRERLGGTE